jgi:hypothetical protein
LKGRVSILTEELIQELTKEFVREREVAQEKIVRLTESSASLSARFAAQTESLTEAKELLIVEKGWNVQLRADTESAMGVIRKRDARIIELQMQNQIPTRENEILPQEPPQSASLTLAERTALVVGNVYNWIRNNPVLAYAVIDKGPAIIGTAGRVGGMAIDALASTPPVVRLMSAALTIGVVGCLLAKRQRGVYG